MRVVAIDTETYFDPNTKGMSVFINGIPNNTPFCLTVSEGGEDFFYDDPREALALLEDESVAKVGANIKYDLHMLANIGIEVKGPLHDVLVINHILHEEDVDKNGKRVRGLKAISDKYLGEGSSDLSKQVDDCRTRLASERKVPKDEISFLDVYYAEPELMREYAMADTRLTLELFNVRYPELVADNVLDVYEEEMIVLRSLLWVERNGYRTDMEYLQELDKELTKEISDLLEEVYEQHGEFNINSANELVAVIEGLGVVYDAKTDKGEYDTSADTLTAIANRSSTPDSVKTLIEQVLKYREANKMHETYVQNLILYTQWDGRVHPSFNQIGTVTGRMSCNNPNFQNFPKGDNRIRKAFVPEEGNRLYFLDFSQQEYRLLAHYAREQGLMNSIKKGHDVHKATAAMLYNKSYEDVTKEERDAGKTLNFARQ